MLFIMEKIAIFGQNIFLFHREKKLRDNKRIENYERYSACRRLRHKTLSYY